MMLAGGRVRGTRIQSACRLGGGAAHAGGPVGRSRRRPPARCRAPAAPCVRSSACPPALAARCRGGRSPAGSPVRGRAVRRCACRWRVAAAGRYARVRHRGWRRRSSARGRRPGSAPGVARRGCVGCRRRTAVAVAVPMASPSRRCLRRSSADRPRLGGTRPRRWCGAGGSCRATAGFVPMPGRARCGGSVRSAPAGSPRGGGRRGSRRTPAAPWSVRPRCRGAAWW